MANLFLNAIKWITSINILDRISEGNGFLITMVGLSAVFIGLIILWFVTASFPRLVGFLEKKSRPAQSRTASGDQDMPGANDSDNIAVAIGVALCCELEEEEVSILTLRHIEQEMSPWVVASKPTTMRHF